jgi:hypothetical protein
LHAPRTLGSRRPLALRTLARPSVGGPQKKKRDRLRHSLSLSLCLSLSLFFSLSLSLFLSLSLCPSLSGSTEKRISIPCSRGDVSVLVTKAPRCPRPIRSTRAYLIARAASCGIAGPYAFTCALGTGRFTLRKDPHAFKQAGYSSVGRASDCRLLQQSDGPWFDSGWPEHYFHEVPAWGSEQNERICQLKFTMGKARHVFAIQRRTPSLSFMSLSLAVTSRTFLCAPPMRRAVAIRIT